ncbi:phosphoadenosine phosphosulfate reductase, partial [Paracoccidioides brasiliensis]
MPSKIPSNYPSDTEAMEIESGYVSGSASVHSIPELLFTKPHLKFLNRQLQFLEPQ